MKPKSKVPHIRFKGFSGEWEEKKIDDVVDDLYNGQTPSRVVNSYWNGTINWLSSGELNRSIVTKTIEKISINGQKSANLRLVSSGTFVMAITGLEAVGTRGNCAILGIDTTLNQSCMAIYPKVDLLNTPFLFHWYRKNSEEYGIKFTQGTKQQSYNASIIKKLDIVLPKIAEQTKIGDYFQHLDKLIKQKENKYQKLMQFKKASLEKMFPRNGAKIPEIRFKGFSGEWEEKSLGGIGQFKSGTGFPEKEQGGKKGIPFYKVSDMNLSSNKIFMNEANNYVSQEQIERMKLKPIDELSIIFAKVGAAIFLERKRIANHFLLDNNMMAFSPNIDISFLFYWVNQIKLSKFAQVGALPSYNANDLKIIEILLPSLDEQSKIAEHFQKLDRLIDLHRQEIKKLRNIKKASLDKMFV